MRYELFLALRYLGGLRRSQPFVSVIAVISVLGVAVGVAALLVVLGVMSGFDADLEAKIVGSNPHLVVEQEGGITDPQALLKKIREVPHVVAAAPFLQTQVILRHGDQATGVVLRGVDTASEPQVTGLSARCREGSWPPPQGALILGSQLAHRLGLREGESVTVIAGERGAPKEMRVAGDFTTGMYEYDLNLALASIETVQGIVNAPDRVSGVGVRLDEAIRAQEMKGVLQRKLQFPYWVVSWMDMNRNLFSALALEKVTMFVILTLIVLVACFNIVATLLMVVVRKTKEIGILKSIGATNTSIRRVFTWVGLLIGFAGTLLGTAGGVGLCGLLAKYQFIQLPPEIYYIDRLPVKLEWMDALTVGVAALLLSWVACLYPAWIAARLQPADAIRYE